MKRAMGIPTLVCAMGLTAMGQMTTVGVSEGNTVRLEWTAIPGNSYVVLRSSNMMEPSWSNLTAAGIVFPDEKGAFVSGMEESRGFFCVASSNDYLVVDISEGPQATNYPVSRLLYVPPGGWTDEYKTTKIVLRRISAGSFTMGSPTNELGRSLYEDPHEVALTQDFYVGVFEVTQKQWERVMDAWPSVFSNTTVRDSRPVEVVSYNNIRGMVEGTNWPANSNVDADSFMGRLRARTGQAFDLPTEAQWEYACRAGTTTALNSGFNLTNVNVDAQMAVVGRYRANGGIPYTRTGDTSVATAKVGSYLPNAWGLYDMHGNVWEWCLDWFAAYPGPSEDPKGADLGVYRVIRGGPWSDYPRYSRAAFRAIYATPSVIGFHTGFRVCLP